MEMELNKDVIKNQRDNRAWSQTQLADVSGLSLRTVQRIEKSGVASQESAKSLAAVFECSITDLATKIAPKQEQTSFLFVKMSSKAKIIHLFILVPVLCIALYLFWTGHHYTGWVNTVRDSIFSHTISEQRLDKISFLILVIVVGLPSLIPGLIYDFISKQGAFKQL